ncbi:MAG: SMC-Scp complex subunit ScpB [Trueperaceae bacterium]|nr:SMC-Scp complex subunit ScpB [Trueperaceae bacterium]
MSVRARLCAALLAAGRPLRTGDLARALSLAPDAVEEATQDLQASLNREGLGLQVEAVAGGYRLVVHPDVLPDLQELLAPPALPPLSAAAIETLAIVAYHQPVTRGELETWRGASCHSTLDTLQERELIKVVGRRDVIGRPLLYGTTEKFLIELGLRSLDDLPPLEEAGDGFLRG